MLIPGESQVLRRRMVFSLSSVVVALVSLSVGMASARAWRDHTQASDQVLIEVLDRSMLGGGADVGADAGVRTTSQTTATSTFEPAAPERRSQLDRLDVPAAGREASTAERAAMRPLVPSPSAATAAPSPGSPAPLATVGRGQDAVVAEAIGRWGSGGLLLAIPRINVTAAVSGLSYEADERTPATPTSAWGVGWYQFTAYPGTGGNAVLSGHVDWYTGAPAVFAGLSAVGAGDTIYAVLPNGTPLTYQVASVQSVQPATADVAAIFGAAGQEALTLITCGGAWDAVAKDYSHRLIVRAYRVR